MDKKKEILVSICCITYNHEKYIRDAIESFLMQKTNFPFEIIIHDDASTDQTPNIIREYEKKYPEIIKPIYQVENQYSKGIKPSLLTYKKSTGKYIAFCEGDDYWTDPLKLQKQITEMEKNPECNISFHPSIMKWDDGSKKDKVLGLHSKENKIFKIEKVILGGGEFMPTNSIIINKLIISRIISFFDIARNAPIGDYYIQILGAEKGGALYLNDIMSVYRVETLNSWSEKILKSSEHYNSFVDSYIATNDKMDAFMNYRYSKQFIMNTKYVVSIGLKNRHIDVRTKRNIIKCHRKDINLKDKILYYTIFGHPKLIQFFLNIKTTCSNFMINKHLCFK